MAIRDRLLTAFDRAAALAPGPLRRRLLTVTFAGGGFSGVEGFGVSGVGVFGVSGVAGFTGVGVGAGAGASFFPSYFSYSVTMPKR